MCGSTFRQSGCDAEHALLVGSEVYVRRLLEQPAVDVAGARVEAARRSVAGAVEPLEQPAEVIGAGAPRVGDEIVDQSREDVLLELTEVLREQAPDRLEQERPQLVGPGGAAVAQLGVEVDDEPYGLARDRLLGADEDRFALAEEAESVELLR